MQTPLTHQSHEHMVCDWFIAFPSNPHTCTHGLCFKARDCSITDHTYTEFVTKFTVQMEVEEITVAGSLCPFPAPQVIDHIFCTVQVYASCVHVNYVCSARVSDCMLENSRNAQFVGG